MSSLLGAIRGLALVGVALSVVALPVGGILLALSVPSDRGDNALGDIIAMGLGAGLLVLGGAGLLFGGILAVLARRALAARTDAVGTRRIVLIGGLGIAGGSVLISSVLAGLSPGTPGAALSFVVGLSALLAAPFVVIAAVSSRSVDIVIAGMLAVGLVGLSVALLVAQVVLPGSPQ